MLAERGWSDLPTEKRISAIYGFARNEVLFGYNRTDNIRASEVLANGYCQCNTKGTLLMALLRAAGIRCRLHGFTNQKDLQRGVVPELVYPIAPAEILHSWVEVDMGSNWVTLEGFILDQRFLEAVQSTFPEQESVCGYAVGTDCLSAPPVNWKGRDTLIQKTGIVQDFGVFETPDAFYAGHAQKIGPLRNWLYRFAIRHWMNLRTRRIRSGRLKPEASLLDTHGDFTDAT